MILMYASIRVYTVSFDLGTYRLYQVSWRLSDGTYLQEHESPCELIPCQNVELYPQQVRTPLTSS